MRDCQTCVFKTADGCVSWDCEYINRDEAIQAYKEKKQTEAEDNESCPNRI